MSERLCAHFHAAGDQVVVRIGHTPALELRGPFPGPPPRYFLRNVTAGMLEGDAYAIEVRVGGGAAVRIEPTAAAKVFIARQQGASLHTRIEVEAGGLLDYDAGLTIPHAGALVRQSTEIVLHPGARVAFSEALAFGRLALGERFAFACVESDLRVVSADGTLLFARRSELSPAEHGASRLDAAVGSAGVLATLLLLGGDDASPPVEVEGTYGGLSRLPHDAGYQAQVLAGRPEQAAHALDAARRQWLPSVPQPPARVA